MGSRTNVEALDFGKRRDTSSIMRVWKQWREGRRRVRCREKEETGRFVVGKMGEFPADGFYLLMMFERSETCWKWPRRKCDESISGHRGESELTRETKYCLAESNPLYTVCPLFPGLCLYVLAMLDQQKVSGSAPSGGKCESILDVSENKDSSIVQKHGYHSTSYVIV